MNTRCRPALILLLALGGTPVLAFDAEPAAPSRESTSLSPAQLDQLLAPIALYPDPLIAILLPAATFPADLVLAARFVAAGGNPESFEAQPWDDSVKALARYPELLKWMDQNLDWTRRVGAAFLSQPAEVLTSTQRLRAAARAAGHLTDTAQQTVVVEQETIRVLPARPDFIHLPIYDYHAVYRPRTVHVFHSGSLIRFSSAYHAGPWLAYHCDWRGNTLVIIDRPRRVEFWQSHPRWVCPSPSASYVRVVRHGYPDRLRIKEPESKPPATRDTPVASIPRRSSGRTQDPAVASPSPAREERVFENRRIPVTPSPRVETPAPDAAALPPPVISRRVRESGAPSGENARQEFGARREAGSSLGSPSRLRETPPPAEPAAPAAPQASPSRRSAPGAEAARMPARTSPESTLAPTVPAEGTSNSGPTRRQR